MINAIKQQSRQWTSTNQNNVEFLVMFSIQKHVLLLNRVQSEQCNAIVWGWYMAKLSNAIASNTLEGTLGTDILSQFRQFNVPQYQLCAIRWKSSTYWINQGETLISRTEMVTYSHQRHRLIPHQVVRHLVANNAPFSLAHESCRKVNHIANHSVFRSNFTPDSSAQSLTWHISRREIVI